MTHLIKTMGELHADYIAYTATVDEVCFDWGKWMPALGEKMRPMVPGELAFFIGDTGTGKTAVLQSIAMAANPLEVLFCEMELPGTLCFERFAAIHTGISCKQVEQDYRQSDARSDLERLEPYKPPHHIKVCDSARIDENDLPMLIEDTFPSKFGYKPCLVMVDYIGLMSSKGSKPYERVARAAQELKRVAKATNTIIMCASQVHRMGEHKAENVGLHSAKNAGEIEESAGIMFGLEREEDDTLLVKCLKSTKDGGGHNVLCHFDGPP